MKELLVLIPARSGSKGLSGKNFRILGGKSLVDRSLLHAQYFSDIADIVVSTDDKLYIRDKVSKLELKGSLSPKEGDLIPFDKGILHIRPKDYSQDNSLIMDLIHHLCCDSNLQKGRRGSGYKAVLLLQPTSPFRGKVELNEILYFLSNNLNSTSSLVSLRDTSDIHPARMYSEIGQGLFEGIKSYYEYRHFRRQDCPKLFIRDGGFYVIGSDLVKQKLQTNSQVIGMKRKSPYSINIDSESDFILAEYYLNEAKDDPNFNSIGGLQ